LQVITEVMTGHDDACQEAEGLATDIQTRIEVASKMPAASLTECENKLQTLKVCSF